MPMHKFKVRSGFSVFKNSDLSVSEGEVRLNEKVILAEEVEWITFEITSQYNTGIKTGSHSVFSIGSRHETLKFGASDLLYGSSNTNSFLRAANLILEYHGPKIVGDFVGVIVSGGTLELGKTLFSLNGVLMPREVLGFFSGKPELVPYSDLKAEVESGQVSLKSTRDPRLLAFFDIAKIKNAYFIPAIVRHLASGQKTK